MVKEKIVYYRNPQSEAGRRFNRQVVSHIPGRAREEYNSIAEFANRLIRHHSLGQLVIYLAEDREEWRDLLAMRSVLDDLKIFVILPDHDQETISQARAIEPRYVGYADEDFGGLARIVDDLMAVRD